MNALDDLKKLLSAAEARRDCYCAAGCLHFKAKQKLEDAALPIAQALVELAAHIDLHDRDCCNQVAQISGLTKAMKGD